MTKPVIRFAEWLLLCCMLFPQIGHAAATPPAAATKQTVLSLHGSINEKYAVHMQLTIKGDSITGSYYYDKHKQTIKLEGSVDSQHQVALTETDSSGQTTGDFEGWLIGNEFAGAWSDASDSHPKQFPFYLTASASFLTAKPSDWAGEWGMITPNQFMYSSVTIANPTSNAASIWVQNVSYGNNGAFDDKAAKLHGRLAYSHDDMGSILVLYLVPGKAIYVDPHPESTGGLGVYFTGQYPKGPAPVNFLSLKELGVLESDTQEAEFKKMTGSGYTDFLYAMGIVEVNKDLDNLQAKVVSGVLPGFYQEKESIVMYDRKSHYWAAVIELNRTIKDCEVDFYTNVPKTTKLPKTIEAWRQRFKSYPVVFKSK